MEKLTPFCCGVFLTLLIELCVITWNKPDDVKRERLPLKFRAAINRMQVQYGSSLMTISGLFNLIYTCSAGRLATWLLATG